MKFSDNFDIKRLLDVDCMSNLCYNLPVFHSRGDCMKKYPGMRKLYFQQKWSIEEAQKKADEFRSQFSAIDLGVEIGNGSPAFILYCDQLIDKITQINNFHWKILKVASKLPMSFLQEILRQFVIEEIRQSNETEGVHSTHKEIVDSMEQISVGKRASRFDGMIRKYQLLAQQQEFRLETCQDVRSLYDEFILDEVAKENPKNIPDGQCFRAGTIGVQDVHGQIIHEGAYPEEVIQQKMSAALAFLNNSEYNPLIRIAAFHFLFANIHPFYDGNGRMARFISSANLKENMMHPLVVLRLSYTIKERRNEYYSLFRDTEDRRNCGDVTWFVIVFLDFILQSEVDIERYLRDRYDRYNHYVSMIENLGLSERQLQALDLLVQAALCDSEGLNHKDLEQALPCSPYIAKKILDKIAQYTIRAKYGRAYRYRADLDKLDQLGN